VSDTPTCPVCEQPFDTPLAWLEHLEHDHERENNA
jgi:hypothetical protein